VATSYDINYEELARSTEKFNGAQLEAVCVEAGMIALREGATKLTLAHEHFLSGISEGLSVILTPSTDADCLIVQSKKKNNLM
jgi:26S proteasome regulatory subunit T5